VGASHSVADEGGGTRAIPAIDGHPALARHIAERLVADEFDMTFFQRRGLDHGCFSPMSLLADHAERWPFAMIPVGRRSAADPSSERPALLEARAGTASGDRELSR